MIQNKELENHYDFYRYSDKLTTKAESGLCYACGAYGPFGFEEIITKQLAEDWELNAAQRRLMSTRESMFCVFCNCSLRLRQIALALSLVYGDDLKKPISLFENIEQGKFKKLKVAEINSCGKLHVILKNIENLKYSEYQSTDKDIRSENLLNLSYKDDEFDLVLTSDTLEHVPTPSNALKEILRILRPGGRHIFTVPALLSRENTTERATHRKDGSVTYKTKKSYHGSGDEDYLVWNEFGADFVKLLEKVGFCVEIYFVNKQQADDFSFVFVTQKPPCNKQDKKKDHSQTTLDVDNLNANLQVKRTSELARKLSLTQNHIKNLEAIVEANKAHIEHLEIQTKLLNKIKLIIGYKIFKKLIRK